MTRKPSLLPAVIAIATLGAAAGAAFLARKYKEEQETEIDLPTEQSRFSELARDLQRAAAILSTRSEKALDNAKNREQLAHMIGIERWGQARLEVILGERDFKMDEYVLYRPQSDLSVAQLNKEFQQARIRTIQIAKKLHENPPHDDVVVQHNGLGPLSATGWLRYLMQHADAESRKLEYVSQATASTASYQQ